VINEIDLAFNNKKTIIPFLVDNTVMNEDFNYYLNRKHWLAAYPDYREKFAELIDCISRITGKKPLPPPPAPKSEAKPETGELRRAMPCATAQRLSAFN
jgi:hypothetical protein